MAGTDELTELANRRSFDRELKRRIAEFNRFGTQFSLIMLDIDNFKSVNDQYGHLVGDEFLKEFAKRLRGQIRESDLLARYGGDEFVAILAGTDLQQAKYAAKRLIDNAILKTVSESNALRLSISIGIAQVQAGLSPDQLIELVDRAMYEAKNKGGDQFAVSDVS